MANEFEYLQTECEYELGSLLEVRQTPIPQKIKHVPTTFSVADKKEDCFNNAVVKTRLTKKGRARLNAIWQRCNGILATKCGFSVRIVALINAVSALLSTVCNL